METTMEMNYCRRCGAPLNNENADVYKCASGHTIFLNAPPATGAVLANDKNEVLMLERAIDPGKGKLDIPGGLTPMILKAKCCPCWPQSLKQNYILGPVR